MSDDDIPPARNLSELPFAPLAADLERLSRRGRRRRLEPAAGMDFTSNDYLALAGSAALREAALEALARHVPVGAGGSRVLRGNHTEHVALESAAALFFGSESALYFVSGYAANLTLFSTAPQGRDLVIHDEKIHASVHDGLRRGRAQALSAIHNDLQSFDEGIAGWRAAGGMGRVWIAVESLYSMDGDGPDLVELAALARRREAILVIDEAHATGVLGPGGRGRAAFLEGHDNVISVHTCGKALGTAGAFVCAPAVLNEYLINRGRPFIFGTAPSPLIAAVTHAALTVCEQSDSRRERLQALVESASCSLERHCGIEGSGSHIQPIIIGADAAAVYLASRLRHLGYDVRAIRPPTVAAGTARLRIALSLNVDATGVEGLYRALGEIMLAPWSRGT